LVGLSAIPATQAATSPAIDFSKKVNNPALGFGPGYSYTDRFGRRWHLMFTGWKACQENVNLRGQVLAIPVKRDYTLDVRRRTAYVSCPGVSGTYSSGDKFDVTRSTEQPEIDYLTSEKVKDAAVNDGFKRLAKLLNDTKVIPKQI
jgi:hypothetical protein